jgi:hypothetical protein
VGVGSLSGMKPLRVGIQEVEPFGREGEPVCCLDGRCYAVGMAYRDCPARRPKARTPKTRPRCGYPASLETVPHVMESLARGDSG